MIDHPSLTVARNLVTTWASCLTVDAIDMLSVNDLDNLSERVASLLEVVIAAGQDGSDSRYRLALWADSILDSEGLC